MTKAISVRQPWAELILQGEKTIEVRKRSPSYRGELVIHAAKIRGNKEFELAQIDYSMADNFPSGAIVGLVQLVDIIRLDDRNWVSLKDKHLIPGNWKPWDQLFGYVLVHPERLVPHHYKGLPAMFSIDTNLIDKLREK